MYQLVIVVCSVNVFDNFEFSQFRACRHGNALWREYCKLKNKFWDMSKKRPTLILADEEDPDINTRRLAAEVGF